MATGKIILEADGKGVYTMFKNVEQGAEHLGNELKGMVAGAIGIESIKEIVNQTFEYAKALKVASEETGASKSDMAAMELFGKRMNIDLEKMIKLFEKANESLGEALTSSEKMSKLKKLGLSEDDIKHLHTLDTILKATKGQVGKPHEEASLALSNLVGPKLGSKLAALVPELSNFNENKKKLQNIGMVPNEDDLDDLILKQREVEETFQKLKVKAIGWSAGIISMGEAVSDGFELIFGKYIQGLFMFIQTAGPKKAFSDLFSSFGEVFTNNVKMIFTEIGQAFISVWQLVKTQVIGFVDVIKLATAGHFIEAKKRLAELGKTALDDGTDTGKHIGNALIGTAKATSLIPLAVDAANLTADKNPEASDATVAFLKEFNAKKDKEYFDKLKDKQRQRDLLRLEQNAKVNRDNAVTKTEKGGGGKIESDSLVGIGNFLGEDMGSVVSVAQQQLTVLQSMENYLAQIAATRQWNDEHHRTHNNFYTPNGSQVENVEPYM